MKETLQLLVAFLCYLCGVLETEASCPYQQCACGETYLICRDRSSDNISVPILLVDLDQAFEIPNKMLPPNLTEITFTNSHIQIIGNRAFDDSATTLEKFSLSNCLVTEISDTFLNLKALKDISISDTNIQNWNVEAMINLGLTAETMTLSNVGLTSWPSWLVHFSNLFDLTVESSNISSIPDHAFDLMSINLTSLSLTDNKLRSVPKALSKLANLQILYLQQNLISNLTWLPPSKVLAALSLNANSISDAQHLSNALLPFANSLSIIDLHGNKLTSIPSLNFLTNVGRLDLSNNRLSDFISGSLPAGIYELILEYNLFPFIPTAISTLESLTTLDLPSNLIMEIRGTDFALTITQVDLDSNQLTELNEWSFPENSKIDSLMLDNNPIASISMTAFRNLAELSTLSLVNSHLARLPLALASLKSLVSLDLTGTKDLLCTCEENILEFWIQSLGREGVMGNCGLTNIYTFFSTLSPNCPA